MGFRKRSCLGDQHESLPLVVGSIPRHCVCRSMGGVPGSSCAGRSRRAGRAELSRSQFAHVYAEEGWSSLRRFVLLASLVFALPMLLFGLAMMLLGGPLVTLLYGPNYAGNGLIVAILAFNLTVSVIAFSFSRALFAIERADVDFIVNFVALFVMLTLGLWLVRSLGVLGAALGLLIANAMASGVRVGVFLKLPACTSGGQRT